MGRAANRKWLRRWDRLRTSDKGERARVWALFGHHPKFSRGWIWIQYAKDQERQRQHPRNTVRPRPSHQQP